VIDILATLTGTWGDGTRPRDLFGLHVAGEAEAYLPQIIDGLRAKTGRVQAGCAELASLLSEARPDLLLPYAELFAGNLQAKAPVLRWEAACVAGNLAALDAERRLVPHIPSLLQHLTHPSIVLQLHSARALVKMARAYPDQSAGILNALVDAAPSFTGSRVGLLVAEMPAFAGFDELRPRARAFVEPYVASELRPVATKARRALRALA
jgi:hypothetical protein